MLKLETKVVSGKEDIGTIKIKRGIFQGDSLSPLLFCLAMNPLSVLLHKAGKEYVIATKEKINHLLYMDDLKLFSKNEEGLNTLINTVKIYSNDIKMEFGHNNSAMLIIQRGKIKKN